MRRAAYVLATPILLAGCSRTYHPEYHPETSYSYVQSATYVKTAIFASGGATAGEPAPKRTGQADPRGTVSSPGEVIIYGDFTGNIYLAR